jgi:pyruvate,orthophosphate dikinase
MEGTVSSIFKFSSAGCDYEGDPASPEAKALLGGKGAGLVMMARNGFHVPPGFTISTVCCNEYRAMSQAQQVKYLDAMMIMVNDYMSWLDTKFGFRPLVSVRSGAPVSMPGMMDTILNVGLTSLNYGDWEERLGLRGAADCERRLVQMLGATAYGVPMSLFDFQLAKIKKQYGVKSDTEMNSIALSKASLEMRKAFLANTGIEFPMGDAQEQMRQAIRAVFDSWGNPRAAEYRKINGISPDMGTAVTVQAMVFGNMGEDSGSGVLFTRNPSTGEKKMMGEFLANAQGEDVVAGIRTPISLDKMAEGDDLWIQIHSELEVVASDLEIRYADMVDVEFTVQKGELFILQSRAGKRSARAAFKIAVDLVHEEKIKRLDALARLTPEQYRVTRRPTIDPKFKVPANLTGLPACPGVVRGLAVYSAKEAVKSAVPCILVTHETNPNDIAGMAKAVGILTQTGGATSHAAVVARAMDKPCVVGCTLLDIEGLSVAPHMVTIDGATGRVWFDHVVPIIDSSADPAIRTVTEWCMELLGTCEIAPVDFGMTRPHCILAAAWWGSKDVMEVVLDSLAELPNREHITLDLANPEKAVTLADAALRDCFGITDDGEAFEQLLIDALVDRSDKLKGLRLTSVPVVDNADAETELSKLGYLIKKMDAQAVPYAVSPEYATFTVLAR